MNILSRTKYAVFAIVMVLLIGKSFVSIYIYSHSISTCLIYARKMYQAQIPYKHPYPEVPFRPPLKIEPYIIHRDHEPEENPNFTESNEDEIITTESTVVDNSLNHIKEMAYNACYPIYSITKGNN